MSLLLLSSQYYDTLNDTAFLEKGEQHISQFGATTYLDREAVKARTVLLCRMAGGHNLGIVGQT